MCGLRKCWTGLSFTGVDLGPAITRALLVARVKGFSTPTQVTRKWVLSTCTVTIFRA